MPISKINPDGTVQIYNTKTGESKNVAPETLGNYNPKLVKDYEDMQAQSQLTQQGVLDVADIAKTNPQLALQAVQGGVKTKPTDAELKKKASLDNAERVVAELERLYYDEQGNPRASFVQTNGIGGRLEGIQKSAAAKAGENPELANYLAQREGIRPLLARAMGDVGNLSKPEQEAAVRGLPTGTTTPQEAKLFFESTRKRLGLSPRESKNLQQPLDLVQALLSGGLSTNNQTAQSQSPAFQRATDNAQIPQQPQQQNPLMQLLQRGQTGKSTTNIGEANWLGKLLLPRASEVQGKQARGEQMGLDDKIGAGGEVINRILAPFFGPLGFAAGGALEGLTKPGTSAQDRVTGGAKQGATQLAMGGLLKVLGIGANKLGLGGYKQAQQAASKATDQGVKIQATDRIREVSKELLRTNTAAYTEKPILNKLVNGENVTPSELLDLTLSIGPKAFTKSKDPRISKPGDIYKALWIPLREKLNAVVPKAGAQISNLSRGHDVVSKLKTTAKIGTGIGATAGGLGLLYGLLSGKLGGNQSSQ